MIDGVIVFRECVVLASDIFPLKRSKFSLFWFVVDLNMMCSNKCAKPDRPEGSSLPATTCYHTCMATVGL